MPALVDADGWLAAYDGHTFVRKVQRGGRVKVAEVPYYVKVALDGQQIGLWVDAAAGQCVVEAGGQEVQRLAIKELGMGTLRFATFATFVGRLCAEARTPWTALRSAPALKVVGAPMR